jgi:hypothetical protein
MAGSQFSGAWPTGRLCWRAAGLLVLVAMAAASPACAQPAPPGTHLLDIRIGSSRSDLMHRISRRGYELAGGEFRSFAGWYGTRQREIDVSFLTQISEDLGLVWGFSTGEEGEKYRISPGIRLGFVHERQITRRSRLSLSMILQLGADLRERTCLADFGAIGGEREVNCRLAASALRPEETLRHTLRLRGIDESRIAVSYVLDF